jgi:hypothetical protein
MNIALRSASSALFILFMAGSALAQAPAAPPDVRSQLPDAARRAWDSAKQLAASNNYDASLVEFQRAYDLSKNPRVLYNMGVVEKLLTHYARAVGDWQRELDEGTGKLTPAEVAELKNNIAIVQQFVAAIVVTANEPDATLSIDGFVVGKTPFTAPVPIDVGTHAVKLTKDTFAPSEQQVPVAAGQKVPVTFTLEPLKKTALVSVSVTGAANAEVWIDGVDMGPAPFKGELEARRHTIEARAPGFVAQGETVEVEYHQSKDIMLSLSAARHEGRLHVTAPDGAEIAIDDRKVGIGTWDGVVSSIGSRQVVVTEPGYQTYSSTVVVADDSDVNLPVKLNKQVTTSWVAWGVGTLLVVAGGIVVTYFVFQPANQNAFSGNLNPGVVESKAFPGVRF